MDIYDPIANKWSAGPNLLTPPRPKRRRLQRRRLPPRHGRKPPGVGTDAVERLPVPEPGGLTFLLLVGTSLLSPGRADADDPGANGLRCQGRRHSLDLPSSAGGVSIRPRPAKLAQTPMLHR